METYTKGQVVRKKIYGKISQIKSGGKSDHYTTTANYFDKLIKTISRVVPIVYEESEETE